MMTAQAKPSLESEIEELVSWLPWFERRKDYPTPYRIAFRALTVLAAQNPKSAESAVPTNEGEQT